MCTVTRWCARPGRHLCSILLATLVADERRIVELERRLEAIAALTRP
jgi:hypothetical protein